MKLMPEDLPDDPVLLKQMLLDAQEVKEAYATHIVDLKEQIKLLRDRLFGRKSEQTVEPDTPQLALFNEPESEPMPSVGDADEGYWLQEKDGNTASGVSYCLGMWGSWSGYGGLQLLI